MKFTPSSSVSSSTTNSLTQRFYTCKGTTFGCFSSFLSRFLCSKTLQTHPSDPIEIDDSKHNFPNFDNVVDGSATPGIVARLMGLDSIPGFDFKPSQEASNSIDRSKSMDSGDCREETEELIGDHRRTKTAFSFRETQSYFELEDDNFFILSFENQLEKKRVSKSGRREKCGRKQRKNRDEQGNKNRVLSYNEKDRLSLKIPAQNYQNLDNNDDFGSQSYNLSHLQDKPSCKKEEINGVKTRKKIETCLAEGKEDEADCDIENSSPVSVLDHREFVTDTEVTTSGFTTEDEAKVRGSDPGRSDSGHEELPHDQVQQSVENSLGQVQVERERGLKRKDYRTRENLQMVTRVCRLAETDIINNYNNYNNYYYYYYNYYNNDNSNWSDRGMSTTKELEDVGSDFGQLIFDELVTELVLHLLAI